jgi:hypothetical protein
VSVLAALAVALIVWSVRGVAQRLLAVVLVGSGVALAVGAAFALALYPWTDLPVLGFAIAGGVLVGRRLPPRPMSILVLLAVLAVIDAVQMVALGAGAGPEGAGGAAPASYFYGMLVLDTPWSHSGVGIIDILVIAAMVEHAQRRGFPFAAGAAPGMLGFVAADPVSPLRLARGGTCRPDRGGVRQAADEAHSSMTTARGPSAPSVRVAGDDTDRTRP